MSLPTDLKNYRADEEDSFVLLDPSECAIILCCVLAFGFILGRL